MSPRLSMGCLEFCLGCKHSQIFRACVFIFEYKAYGFYEQEWGLSTCEGL